MIERSAFDAIKSKHGAYASWALWSPPISGRPKSNIGDLDVLDPERNPALLSTLRNDVVMLGLSLSDRHLSGPVFANFHDRSPRGKDYKVRFAFTGTPFWGGYMTDLVKGVSVLHAAQVVQAVRANPALMVGSVDILLEEIADLGGPSPTLIAFGGQAYQLALHHVPRSVYSTLHGVTHYSHYIGQESYRTLVWSQLRLST